MSDFYEAKYEELLAEFDRYVLEHPDFAAHIPDEALVVLLDSQDAEFSRRSRAIAERYLAHDDKQGRPVVFVDVGQLAPARSRLIQPRIVSTPMELAMARNGGLHYKS